MRLKKREKGSIAPFSTRMPPQLIDELRLSAIRSKVRVCDLVTAAIVEKLQKINKAEEGSQCIQSH